MSRRPTVTVTEKEQMYVALFEEQARRGLTVPALSRETGIPASTLTWWRKEIRLREARRSSGPTGFLPVTVREETRSCAPSGFEVLLPNGVRLHVPSAFDEGALHRLVVTLASAC